MSLHLLKLCVGCDSITDLEAWIAQKLKASNGNGPREHIHITRMSPRRANELTNGGSLYWVIRGLISCRQKLLAIRPFTDRDGINRCALVLDPAVVAVEPRPMRAFQGWRYVAEKDAPRDLDCGGQGLQDMPETMRRDLRELGLL
jgi:hypothetical protein